MSLSSSAFNDESGVFAVLPCSADDGAAGRGICTSTLTLEPMVLLERFCDGTRWVSVDDLCDSGVAVLLLRLRWSSVAGSGKRLYDATGVIFGSAGLAMIERLVGSSILFGTKWNGKDLESSVTYFTALSPAAAAAAAAASQVASLHEQVKQQQRHVYLFNHGVHKPRSRPRGPVPRENRREQ